MMKKLLAALLLFIACAPALGQTSITAKDAAGATQTFKTFNCSSTICPLSVPTDTTGTTLTGAAGSPSTSALTIQGISGGQAVPISGTVTVSQATAASLNATVVGTGTFAVQAAATEADGANVTLGAKADAVCGSATGTCSLEALTKFVANAVSSSIPAGSATIGNVGQVASIPVSGTLQSAAVANGNGTLLLVNGMSSAILTVNCASCSGGTTVNFEATEDNTNFTAVTAVQVGTTTLATTTTTSGITIWQMPVAGFQNIRARISAYSAGTITVTGHTVPVAYDPKTINANIVANTATNQSVNVAQVNGVTVLTGTGAVGTGTQRVAVGTDTATIAGSAPGTAGTASTNVVTVQGIASMTKLLVTPDSVALPANQSVNVSQFNGVTPLMNNGVSGTGSQRMNIASDNSAVAGLGAGATASAVPANAIYQGVNIGGNTTGLVGDPCDVNAHVWTPINISSAANTKIVTGTSAKKTYICHLFLFAAAADNVGIVEGSGTNCATSTLGLIGGTTAATGINLAANQGFESGTGAKAIAASTVNANDFCLITSTAAQLSGVAVTVVQ
jgi:hypothetical protein